MYKNKFAKIGKWRGKNEIRNTKYEIRNEDLKLEIRSLRHV